MQFSDTDTKLGIIQDIATWCFSNSDNDNTTSYPLADKVRNANAWYEQVVSLIMLSDNRWEWDDVNQTDLPIATSALVADQQDYGLDAAVQYKITRVEILDSSGSAIQLKPISQTDKRGTALTEYQSTAGTPAEYDLIGNSVFLYPKPNYSKAAGLKLYFQRGASYFTSSDTTKAPGFNRMFHRIIPMGASLDWISVNHSTSPKIPLLERRIEEMKKGIINFYSTRHRDSKPNLKLAGKRDFSVGESANIHENSVG